MVATALERISNRTTLADLAATEAIDLLGTAVDAAHDAQRSDVFRHIVETLAGTIDRAAAAPKEACLLDYFLANAWNGIKLLSSGHAGGGWDWESRPIEQETICLRRAIASDGLLEQPVIRVCQIHTNLANCYDTTGRFVEAIAEWNRALLIEPRFGMARANRAVGLWTYAKFVYDDGHALVLAREAWAELDPSRLERLEPEADAYFARVRDEIWKAVPEQALTMPFDFDGFELGKTEAERVYREWCLKNTLFLNPLNDIGPMRIAAQDILTCPPIVAKVGQGPRFHDFMNQIKQEYCSARWLVHDATREHAPHFSDKDVLLYNTLDYPSYGLRTESLKLGFRALYSLFDKIAFFLNAYLDLGIAERDVSFRGLWYDKQRRAKGVRTEFAARENWPLRGLFWLGKDLYEDSEGFREVIDPAARRLSEIRNHLEHKYLKLHSEMWSGSGSGVFTDSLATSLGRSEFEDMTMQLLRMVRASLIYLTLGLHREERNRADQRGPDKITPPMTIETWEDDWKQ
jgi:tetratricopeptide (TPR) repeat protein